MHPTTPHDLEISDHDASELGHQDFPTVPASLTTLLTRRSAGPRHLAFPAPNEAHLTVMALAALRAPDHGALTPYRFIVVESDSIDLLADLFGEAARAEGASSEAAALEMERARRAPLTIAVIANLSVERPIPAHEQWMAVGGAIANFLNAAHALGFAGKMLSGRKVLSPCLARAFCKEGEYLVGWIVLGTLNSGWTPPKARHPHSILSKWPCPQRPGAQDRA